MVNKYIECIVKYFLPLLSQPVPFNFYIKHMIYARYLWDIAGDGEMSFKTKSP